MPRWNFLSQLKTHVNLALGLLLSVTLLGCGAGSNKLPTVEVSGVVTLDGERLDRALIIFDPIAGNPGPRAAGVIRNGEYFLEPNAGPVVGPMRVAIVSEIEDDTPAPNQLAKPYTPEKLPKQYNSQSILLVETSLDGPNNFDFDLRRSGR
ncbi:MAG: hypothetical protein V4719_01915 [Planctomycetota bacterium]